MQKWIMSIVLGIAGLLFVILLLFNLPAKEEAAQIDPPVSIPETPVDTSNAESIYKSNCMHCHGDEYQGAMGPALNQVGSTLGREKIYKQIVHGGGGMPGYEGRLSEEEIVNLANWLGAFK
ncbi:mono/diheme cytochrome c family protein [Paenibacillus endophyticus]|uniref:Mono/diheme cytochrome c family protein n=1 Tax=Paenibacillus endophyticus TaxID=1294268 RepID=A0A7W5CBN1_9BACL|nr:cytochrome c [Paenibacillus endophyticus]MBB3153829.1 mono/diheme cytochrome c family protein [Paenibacillus endophyticus]